MDDRTTRTTSRRQVVNTIRTHSPVTQQTSTFSSDDDNIGEESDEYISEIDKPEQDIQDLSYKYMCPQPRSPIHKESLETKHTHSESKKVENSNVRITLFIISVMIFLLLSLYMIGPEGNQPKSMMDITKNYHQQEEVLFKAIEQGINDTIRFGRPSSFIFLYEEKAESTLKDLLDEFSKYAVCYLSKCSNVPIQLDNAILKPPEFTNDYGTLLSKFKNDLTEKGVMVVERLDKIPGIYAQAFHTFCDEYSPLVEKSVFLFTIKVDRFGESTSDSKQVEKILKQRWSNIDDDKFQPLFARISGMLLRVHPE